MKLLHLAPKDLIVSKSFNNRWESHVNATDEIVFRITTDLLKSADFEIEAANLGAIVEDSPDVSLDLAMEKARSSEVKGGAFGMEIVGTLIIPVVIAAAREFWAAYQEKLVEKLATKAADLTVMHVENWFESSSASDKEVASQYLAEKIRFEGQARGIAKADVDALVAAAIQLFN